MKISIAVVFVALLALTGAFLLRSDSNTEDEAGAGYRSVVGVVAEVDQTPLGAEYVAHIFVDTIDGRVIVAVPTDVSTCAAADTMAAPLEIAVGDEVITRGKFDAAGSVVPCDAEEDHLTVHRRVTDMITGLTLAYRVGPEAHMVQTHEQDGLTDPSFVQLYTIALRKEYEQFLETTEASEGPPVINISIFANPEGRTASEWVDARPELSNIGLLFDEVDRNADLAGVAAVRYVADGLYLTDIVVVAHNEHIVLFAGAYIDADSTIRQDFIELLETVSFSVVEG